MSRAIYLTALGPASGKSLVALGLVELVSQRVSRVGFFRPIVQSLPDNDIELVRTRYQLPDERVGYAFVADHLRSLLSASRDEADAGMAQAVAAYKQLEQSCDLVVIEGTDFTGPSSHLEFGFNARVARHLGAPVVAVVNGHDRAAADIVETVRVSEESLVGQGDSVLALIVNRVPPKVHGELASRLAGEPVTAAPVWALPEDDALRYPTLAELGAALGAEVVAGDPDDLTREVRHVKVAAMSRAQPARPRRGRHGADHAGRPSRRHRHRRVDAPLRIRAERRRGRAQRRAASGRPRRRADRRLRRRRQATADVRRRRRHVRHGEDGRRCRGPDHRRQRAQDRRRARPVRGQRRPRVLEERIHLVRSTVVTPVMFQHELIERAKQAGAHIVLPEGTDDRVLEAADRLSRRKSAS